MTPVIMAHGYSFDPESGGHSPFPTFNLWRSNLLDFDAREFPWYSVVPGRDVWRAIQGWTRGECPFPHTYSWAYSWHAVKAAARLAAYAEKHGPIDVICHSLGSRVALVAIRAKPEFFRRVVILNGAQATEEALDIIDDVSMYPVRFLNVAVEGDDTVRGKGSWFGPKWGREDCLANGVDKVCNPRLFANLREVVLDDPLHQEKFPDWDLRGDGPGYGDHSFSYEHRPNWQLYRAFLKGELT